PQPSTPRRFTRLPICAHEQGEQHSPIFAGNSGVVLDTDEDIARQHRERPYLSGRSKRWINASIGRWKSVHNAKWKSWLLSASSFVFFSVSVSPPSRSRRRSDLLQQRGNLGTSRGRHRRDAS